MGAVNLCGNKSGVMKSCVFFVLALAAVAIASSHIDEDFSEEYELLQDIPAEEDLMSVVHEMRRFAPMLLQEHVKVVAHHAELIQDSKAKAYAHDFSKSQAAIKAAIKSLNAELQTGHDHDVKTLKTSQDSGNKIVTDADTAAKIRVREYRDRACPTKRSEEAADSKKQAAKKKMDGIADTNICGGLSTTWGDMDIDKTTAKYGTALRNGWDKVRADYVKARTAHEQATKEHHDAIAAHQRSMAGFTTALGIEAQNVVDTCNAAHKQYDTLVKDVQSNVNMRKQTYVAGLVIQCYVDNITSNSGAKKCADGARGADVSRWNIDGGKLGACASNASNQNNYGPKDWKATTTNCKGHKASKTVSLVGGNKITLTKGKVLTNTFKTYPEYDFSFDINPSATAHGWHNILHFAVTAKSGFGTENSRIPAIWFFSDSTRLHIRQGAKGGNHNDGCDPTEQLPKNAWTTVKISLRKKSFQVFYNGKNVCHSKAFPQAGQHTDNVTVYASDIWSPAAKADVKNIKYTPA